VIQCLWTPTIIVMEKIRNIIAIDNGKYPIEDRLMTFDAPEHYVLVGTQQPQQKSS
jgi:hypothetical protein